MFGVGRSFRTRIERQVVLLFLVFCVVPLVTLTWLAARLVENETLDMSRRHLAEFSKDYALDLISRLDMAIWELGRYGGQGGSGVWVVPLGSMANAAAVERPLLRAVDGGLELQVPATDGRLARGLVRDDVLFADLEHLPFGVHSCVSVAGEQRRCEGEAPAGPAVSAAWTLPLMSLYATDLTIRVVSRQPEAVALRQIGLTADLLPYTAFTVMAGFGWYVMRRIRGRLAPIGVLQEATRRIGEGRYEHEVDIRSGDELEGLGRAFNTMARSVRNSFSTMKALSEMDRLALIGAEPREVTARALELLDSLGLPDARLWLWWVERDRATLFSLDGCGGMVVSPAPFPPRSARSEVAAREYFAAQVGEAVADARPILREGRLVGLLLADRQAPSGIGDVLTEVADRLSVAATLFHRASELHRQANYDGLTGLLNREAFGERLEQATRLAGRENERGALLFLDLDRFKQVNDTEGHHAGDDLLRIVAERMRAVLRPGDEAARLGGDEFAVLVRRVGASADVEAVCRRLVRQVGQPAEVGGGALVMEVSIGVAVFPDDGDDAATLMRKADVAMYKAKEHSGSAFTFFDAAMNRDTEYRAQVESRTRQGLRRRELGLYFQPKVRVADGMVIGVEGLLRWPAAPDLSPAAYIPVLEHTGLIHELTGILVEDAHACLTASRQRGFALQRVSINISPRQFQRDGFCDEFLEHITRVGARPADFEIELTESVLMHDIAAVIRDLGELRAAGVTVALDDFGTGYSSLNMLRQLPLDVIKIDRSFVAPIADSAPARDLLGRIVDIIRSLSLQSVAEGVETERELRILQAQRCDVVQGFLFSPALPIVELVEFLETRAGRIA